MKKIYETLRTTRTAMMLIVGLLILVATTASAQSVITDKLDYAPGETVYITGSHFQPYEDILLTIVHIEPNMPEEWHPHESATVAADSLGNFEGTWYVNDVELNTTLELTAEGITSGLIAVTTFTDAGNLTVTIDTSSPTICKGNNVILTATFSGTNSNVFYLWSPGGATTQSITVAPLSTTTYSVKVTEDKNTPKTGEVSAEVAVNSISAGVISKGAVQPGPSCGSLDPGITAVTSAATGSGALTYEWQKSTDYGSTWTTIASETNSQINPASFTTTTSFKRIASSTLNSVSCSAESNILTYVVNPVPTVALIIPGGATNVCVGSTLQFSNSTLEGVWGTTTPTLVNISEVGLVTGILEGAAKVTYTVTNEFGCSTTRNKTVNVLAQPDSPTANNYDAPYDGNSQTATATAPTGSTVTYYDSETNGNVVSAPSGTNAGTNITVWAESVSAAGCKSASRTPITLTITKATSTTTVSIIDATFDGNAHSGTATVTGPGGLSQVVTVYYEGIAPTVYSSSTTPPNNAGTYKATANFAGDANHEASSDSKNFSINKAAATILVNGYEGTYDGAAHGATLGSATGVNSENLASFVTVATTTYTDYPGGKVAWSFESNNYVSQNGEVDIVINKCPITITADAKSKYCGQPDSDLTYIITNGSLTCADNFSGSLTREPGESSGNSYAILQGTIALSTNYALTYVGANLTINGVSIDASASSSPVQNGSAKGLTASVTPNVSGVSVTFVVTNEADGGVFTETVTTDASGVATATVSALAIPTVGVYKIVATAGSGCAESTAYFPVFDPTESFVTGGGWINSPAGALASNPDIIGKANFGFVSKYKKGKTLTTEVDGNTEFQFQAGDINFKSTMHESGSLVISGGKATYRGTGTINGLAGYKFLIVAIDGNWNNGTEPDRFRIKISTTTGTVIYDNQMGVDENNADATILGNDGTGGGSIVIHEVKTNAKTKSAEITTAISPVVENVDLKVYPNPFSEKLRFEFVSPESVNARIDLYDITGRMVKTIFEQVIDGGVSYEAEFKPETVISGMYIYRMTMGEAVYNDKVVFKKE